MATRAQLRRLGVRPRRQTSTPPQPGVVQLPTSGSVPLDVSGLADVSDGNVVTITNTGSGAVKLKLVQPELGTCPSYAVQRIAPGPGFNPTPGQPDSAPVDPGEVEGVVRPILVCMSHNMERFIDDHVLDFFSYADGGLASLEFNYNGNVVVMNTALSYTQGLRARTKTDCYDDQARVIWSQAIALDHSAHSADGYYDLYVKAVPIDETQQARVMGPYRFHRKTGSFWDTEILFGPEYSPAIPGVSYPDLDDAIRYLDGQTSIKYARVRATTSHTYDANGVTNGGNWGSVTDRRDGCIDIWPDEGVKVLIQNTGALVSIRMNQEGIRWRKGMRLNQRGFNGYNHETTLRPHSLCGAEVFSDLGYFDTSGATGDPAQGFANTRNFNNFYMYEVYWHDQIYGPKLSRCHRFCTVKNIAEDAFSPPSGLLEYFNYGSTVINQNAYGWRHGEDMFSISYVGPSSSATINRNGNDFELKEGGAVVHTIALSGTQGSGVYSTQDLVDAINAYGNGWSATLIDGKFRARYAGSSPPSASYGYSITNINVNNFGYTVRGGADLHGDGYQWASSTHRNHLYCGTRFIGGCKDMQHAFFDAQSDGIAAKGVLMVNCYTDCDTPGSSQFSNKHSNIKFLQNTWPFQTLWPRGENPAPAPDDGFHWLPDEACEIGCNLLSVLQTRADSVAYQGDVALIADNDILVSASAATGARATGNTYDCDLATELPNAAYPANDFTPQGKLADGSHLKRTRLAFDIDGRPRASLTTAGAVENYALLPAGTTVTYPIEWLRHAGLLAVTVAAAPGAAVGLLTLSAKAGAGETGATVSQEIVFDVAA